MLSIRCRKFLLLVLTPVAAGLLASCGSTPLKLPPPVTEAHWNDYEIVPGERIGAVSIGMTSQQLLEAMGQPVTTVPQGGLNGYKYEPGDLVALVDNDTQRVFSVSARSPYELNGGDLKSGQSELSMRATLGNPQSSRNIGNDEIPYFLYCYTKGVSVHVMNGTIDTISIFYPGNVCW